MRIFSPDLILDWTDDADTALCPSCGIDSVLGDAWGLAITMAFLEEMRLAWFC